RRPGSGRRSTAVVDDHRTGGDLWINVVGITDGCIGLNGKPATADDVLEYLTEEFRATLDAGRELPEGVLLDPTCGMQVRENRGTLTLDHDGQRFGFCAE